MNGLFRHLGRDPEVLAVAPGRVNLIGEHTDYNGGLVLPTPIGRQTTVAIAERRDRRVRIASANMSADAAIVEFELGKEERTGDWGDLARGVTRILADQGHRFPGFDAFVDSDIPLGRGLASSAALAVALMRVLRKRFALDLGDLEIARSAQRAESDFVGARVGIMDPLVSSLGQAGEALFLDTRDLSTRSVRIPARFGLIVMDSGTGHRHATGEYNYRREECEKAAELLGVGRLGELTIPDLQRISTLPETLRRRARHVVTENARVAEAVRALEADAPEKFGALLDASHTSLRDDFMVSTPAIEILVGALRATPAVLGARITGGGFGGAVLAITHAGHEAEAVEWARRRYAKDTGHTASVVVPEQPADPLPRRSSGSRHTPRASDVPR